MTLTVKARSTRQSACGTSAIHSPTSMHRLYQCHPLSHIHAQVVPVPSTPKWPHIAWGVRRTCTDATASFTSASASSWRRRSEAVFVKKMWYSLYLGPRTRRSRRKRATFSRVGRRMQTARRWSRGSLRAWWEASGGAEREGDAGECAQLCKSSRRLRSPLVVLD